jgi:hypothetical protein
VYQVQSFVCVLHSTITIRRGVKTIKCEKCDNFPLGIAGDIEMLEEEEDKKLSFTYHLQSFTTHQLHQVIFNFSHSSSHL